MNGVFPRNVPKPLQTCYHNYSPALNSNAPHLFARNLPPRLSSPSYHIFSLASFFTLSFLTLPSSFSPAYNFITFPFVPLPPPLTHCLVLPFAYSHFHTQTYLPPTLSFPSPLSNLLASPSLHTTLSPSHTRLSLSLHFPPPFPSAVLIPALFLSRLHILSLSSPLLKHTHISSLPLTPPFLSLTYSFVTISLSNRPFSFSLTHISITALLPY